MAIFNRILSKENKQKLVKNTRRKGYMAVSRSDLLEMFRAERLGNKIAKEIEIELSKIGLCIPDFDRKKNSTDQEFTLYPLDICSRVKPLERHSSKYINSIPFAVKAIAAINESEPICLAIDYFRSTLIQAVPVVDDDYNFKGVVFPHSVEGISRKKTAVKNFTQPIKLFYHEYPVRMLAKHFLNNPESVVAVSYTQNDFRIISLCDILAALHE